MVTENPSMSSNAGTTLSVRELIIHANGLSERLQLLLSNDRQHVTKTNRDHLCLLHWSLVFDHHQAIFLLLQHGFNASAFALLRPFEEAFLRSFLAMYGTENQVEALWAGTYNTEFEVIGRQIDQKLGLHPVFGPSFKDKIKILHGFTHGGKEQLVRQSSRFDIVSSYTDEEVRALIRETMPIAFLTAVFVTEFLDYQTECKTALEMFSKYVQDISPQLE